MKSHAKPMSQRGAALVTSLIFLTILTLLGMSSMGTALLENRMAGNHRDRNLAYQSAELGLRDAEQFISHSGRISGNVLVESAPSAGDGDYLGSACSLGFCYNGPNWSSAPNTDWIKNPVWTIENFWANAIQYQRDNASTAKGYGRDTATLVFNAPYTLPAAIPLVSAQPEYLIESFSQKNDDTNYYYRITVRGYGVSAGTRVMLQEVYRP